MGFYSWKTQDTNKSIANRYSSRTPFDVYMTDDKGNKWHETNYEGYGKFGGKDYYELLSEMNGLGSDRSKGINLAYSGQFDIKFPNLSEDKNWIWKNSEPERCEFQGYFYEDNELEIEEE